MSNLLNSQKTTFVPNEKLKKEWVLVDAKDQILGRVASRIAYRVMGKHRIDFTNHQDNGDYVVVINAKHIRVTGKKLEDKEYKEHSQYPGGLSITSLKEKLERSPTYALRKAVQRMLPKGPLGRKLMTHVRFYEDEKHDQHSQKPKPIEVAYR